MKSILSVDQKNMFYMLSETMWTHKEYPSDSNTENELWNLQDFQEAYERGADTVTDETSFPTGIEHVYYVDPENVKEAFKLWDYQDEPEKAQQKRRRAGREMPPDLERILKWIIMSILLTVAAEFLSSPC